MKDLLGREAVVGTWIAYRIRCGNSGGLAYGKIEEIGPDKGDLCSGPRVKISGGGSRERWVRPARRFVVIEAPSEAPNKEAQNERSGEGGK